MGWRKPLDYFKVKQGVIPARMTGKGLLPDSDYKSVIVGYHTSIKGNGCHASLRYCTWGAPVIGVAP